MRDDQIEFQVASLPDHIKDMLLNREYTHPTISAMQLAREFAGWKLGDGSWADAIIHVYKTGVDAAAKHPQKRAAQEKGR